MLIANGIFGNVAQPGSRRTRTTRTNGRCGWKTCARITTVRYEYQRFTFEKFGEQLRLVSVDASAGFPAEIGANIDRMLEALNARKSTPVDRCLKDGGTGYRFGVK